MSVAEKLSICLVVIFIYFLIHAAQYKVQRHREVKRVLLPFSPSLSSLALLSLFLSFFSLVSLCLSLSPKTPLSNARSAIFTGSEGHYDE
jgi:hypothetical protein